MHNCNTLNQKDQKLLLLSFLLYIITSIKGVYCSMIHVFSYLYDKEFDL